MADPDDRYGVASRARRVRTRRAWLLLLMGAVVPGSAQLAHGSLGLGRAGLRTWLTLLLVAILGGAAFYFFTDQAISFLAHRVVLYVLAGLVALVGVILLIVLLNTWWLARPGQIGPISGALLTIVTALLGAVLAFGCVTAVRDLVAAGSTLGGVLAGGGDTKAKEGRYNILLLGADSGPDREGLRPDSITVASVDAATGRTVLFGLPRNLENAQFAAGTPLKALYPQGYTTCDEENCMLNSVYLLGEEHADLFPSGVDPGVQAMIDVVTGTLGLEINYYAMVDMAGFAALIDAVGGIDITLAQETNLGIMDDWAQEHIEMTLPAGTNHMDGATALLYARSRIEGNDFTRMARQKCVMAAMLNQLQPSTVAASFTSLASAAGNLLETSVPPSEVGELSRLALKARALPIVSISFTPPLIATGNPDFSLIRSTVREAIEAAEAADEAADDTPASQSSTAGEAPATAADPGEATATAPSLDSTAPPTEVDDLTAICQAA
ncbi:MAG: LCP family protein [Propionibacteriaceae bacterium]|nr:LCP family protein [Propionibacteriaceae bacterium]